MNIWSYTQLNGLHQVQKTYLIYLCVETSFYALSYVKERIKNIFILDLDDQNIIYVFASKGT
jgi:hypothetical protein